MEEIRRRSGGGSRLLVEAGGNLTALRQALAAALPGIEPALATSAGEIHRLELPCRDADDAALRATVGRECATRGIPLRELTTRHATLEDLFGAIAGPASGLEGASTVNSAGAGTSTGAGTSPGGRTA